MLSPRVSIVLPFRNSGSTLEQAVRSIADGSYQNWQLILVDNASTDRGPSIAAQWAERDQRVTCFSESTIGVAYALNSGVAQAKGTYIARMDADDIAHPERLHKQVEYLDAHPEIGVIGTRTRFVSSVENNLGMEAFVNWQNAILTPREHYVKRFVDAPLAHPSVMFRRSLVDRYGGYDTGPLPEDHELWLRWMHQGVRLSKLPEELLTWSDRAERLSRTHPNYSVDAFYATKVKWIAAWYKRKYAFGFPVIIAGTSKLCIDRSKLLEEQGVNITAFTDVKARKIPGYEFVPHSDLPSSGNALIISFISQRGTGDRIAEFLASGGLVEGDDFILAA